MRMTFVLSALAVTAFASYVVSKTPAESYGADVCPPPYSPSVVSSNDAVAQPQGGTDERPQLPFERPDPAQKDVTELSQMTVEQLLALDDDAFMTGLTRKLLLKREHSGFDSLTPTEQVVLRAEALGIKLSREGFLGFYASPYGDYDKTLAALEAIESKEMAALLRRTLVVFGGVKPPLDDQARLQLLGTLEQSEGMSPFEELDAGAQQLIGPHADAVARYARKNIAGIRP